MHLGVRLVKKTRFFKARSDSMAWRILTQSDGAASNLLATVMSKIDVQTPRPFDFRQVVFEMGVGGQPVERKPLRSHLNELPLVFLQKLKGLNPVMS
jgi:hypothetical protein